MILKSLAELSLWMIVLSFFDSSNVKYFYIFKQKNEKIRAENCFICYTWFVASSRKDPQDGDAL